MIVKFKEKILRLEEHSTLEDFKHENLKREKLLIKNFFYENYPINERLLTKHIIYTCEMDQNEFDEYTKGKYRNKNCRKY